MKATVLDTITGETRVVDGIDTFSWAENNWSCDCNRNYFGVEVTEKCVCERFIVIAAEFSQDIHNYTGEWLDGVPIDTPCSLRELNSGYPEELLVKHGIK